MKIGTRITLNFTAFVAILFALLLFSIYVLNRRFTRNEFYDLLYARALIQAKAYLDKDESSSNLYREAGRQYAQNVSEEIVRITDAAGNYEFIENTTGKELDKALVARIQKEKHLRFEHNERQYVGILYPDRRGDFVILASAENTTGKAQLTYLRNIMLLSYFATLIGIYLVGILFSRKALQPIQRLLGQVKLVKASNLHLRVDEGKGKDEISALAATFNRMLQHLEESFIIQKAFVSNASHELRTPLTVMIGELQVLISKERSHEEYRQSIASVLHEAEDMNALLNDLLIFARVDAAKGLGTIEEIRLDDLLWEINQKLQQKDPRVKIRLELLNLPDNSDLLNISGNRHLLSVAFTNIIDNAVKYSDFKEVNVQFIYRSDEIRVAVIDRGIGIDETDQKYIYEPFFRGANARNVQGTGIGIPLSARILKLHNGRMDVVSEKNKGTTVTIRFSTAVPGSVV